MNSSFGTIVERHRRPLSRRFLGWEPPANQPSTSKFARHEISDTTDWGLLKQPDNQKTSIPNNILTNVLSFSQVSGILLRRKCLVDEFVKRRVDLVQGRT